MVTVEDAFHRSMAVVGVAGVVGVVAAAVHAGVEGLG